MDPLEHMAQADYLTGIAEHPLIAANLPLQSEVLWGAAAQAVKAVAKSSNLPSESHRELFRAVREFARRTADADLLPEFGNIEKLHINFYDGEMDAAEIARHHRTTTRFVAKMQRILNASYPAV